MQQPQVQGEARDIDIQTLAEREESRSLYLLTFAD